MLNGTHPKSYTLCEIIIEATIQNFVCFLFSEKTLPNREPASCFHVFLSVFVTLFLATLTILTIFPVRYSRVFDVDSKYGIIFATVFDRLTSYIEDIYEINRT